MHKIVVKTLRIITFMTLVRLSDLRVNPVESSQSTFYSHESNRFNTEVYAAYFRNPVLTCGIILLILWILFQTCYFGRCKSDNENRNIASYICHLVLYACKWHVNLQVLQRLFTRHRNARTDGSYSNYEDYSVCV